MHELEQLKVQCKMTTKLVSDLSPRTYSTHSLPDLIIVVINHELWTILRSHGLSKEERGDLKLGRLTSAMFTLTILLTSILYCDVPLLIISVILIKLESRCPPEEYES